MISMEKQDLIQALMGEATEAVLGSVRVSSAQVEALDVALRTMMLTKSSDNSSVAETPLLGSLMMTTTLDSLALVALCFNSKGCSSNRGPTANRHNREETHLVDLDLEVVSLTTMTTSLEAAGSALWEVASLLSSLAHSLAEVCPGLSQ